MGEEVEHVVLEREMKQLRYPELEQIGYYWEHDFEKLQSSVSE